MSAFHALPSGPFGHVDVVVVVALPVAVVDVLVVRSGSATGLNRRRRGGADVCRFGRTARERPPPPTPTYMRVLPFGSVATSNSARSTSAPVAGLDRVAVERRKICVHVFPVAVRVERQMPLAKNEA